MKIDYENPAFFLIPLGVAAFITILIAHGMDQGTKRRAIEACQKQPDICQQILGGSK